MDALCTHLGEHLDEEEQKVLPLAAANLSMEEWGALPAHGMANFHGDKIWLILGLIRERMTDEQRAEMTGAPAAARPRHVDGVRRAGLQGLLDDGRGGGREPRLRAGEPA